MQGTVTLRWSCCAPQCPPLGLSTPPLCNEVLRVEQWAFGCPLGGGSPAEEGAAVSFLSVQDSLWEERTQTRHRLVETEKARGTRGVFDLGSRVICLRPVDGTGL